MKFFLISDNIDTKIGMRLAGIEGEVVHSEEDLIKVLEEVCKNDQIGIVLVSQKLIDMFPKPIYDIKLKRKIPLIVKIPDRHGNAKISETIEEYIQKSVGIKI